MIPRLLCLLGAHVWRPFTRTVEACSRPRCQAKRIKPTWRNPDWPGAW